MFKINLEHCAKFLLSAMLILSGFASVMAQEGSATLRGEVLDPSGAVVPGAQVSVANQETGLNRRSVTTSESGDYVFASLTPGLYRVTVEAANFKKSVKENVRLNVGETQEFNFSLEVGGSQETVTVTADEPLVETSTSKIGGTISQQELLELPSVNRNFIGFVGLLPGVVPNISTESFGADAVSVNGQDPRYNNFTLDGANNNDDVIGQRAGSQTRTALEAVQEFQVLTNQFSAEFGRTSGGIINAVTKSGTNSFRGSVFGFFQDSSLNSKSRFAELNNLEDAEASYKQFGGTIGGPIKKDFAHFFFSFEKTNIDQGIIVDIPARPSLNASTATLIRATNILLRGDMQPSQKHQVSIRYLRENSPQLNQIIGAVTLAAAREEADVDQTTVGSWTYNLTSNLLNDLRLSFTQEDVAFATPAFNANGGDQAALPPTLQFNTFLDQQNNTAQTRINNSYRLADTLTWIKGAHSLKFGLDYNYVTADSVTQDNLNGTFIFPFDLPFDPLNPRSYPERLTLRVGGPLRTFTINHNTSVFVQDDWKVNRKLTLNLGLRYDDETISSDNNNFSPRLGFAYDPTGDAKTVIRGGFGFFYQNTPFELITAFRTAGPFSTSFNRNFPLLNPDPGPRAGARPTDPVLVNGPVIDRALIASIVGSSTLLPNPTPTVDNAERQMPYTRSFSVGLQRELIPGMAVTADYIHTDGVNQFVSVNLNPGRRASTATTGPTATITRQFSTLGAVIQNSFVPVITDSFSNLAFQNLAVTNVTTRLNVGETKYDALQLSLDKRLSRGLQFKASYTLSKGTGNVSGSGTPTANFQTQTGLNLEEGRGPTAFDRRHNFVFSGLYRVPRTRGLVVSTIIRALSGTPFTIFNSTIDANQNGINFDPLPAGTYTNSRTFANGETLRFEVDNKGGFNGARLPGFFSVDLRLAYKFNFTERINAGFTFEVFNLANRANYDELSVSGNTSQSTFLTPSIAKPPRTLQLGFRVAF